MNLYDYSLPDSGEAFATLLSQPNVTIERIVSSRHVQPKTYMQDHDEWVVLLEGAALIRMDDKDMQLRRGDSLLIPAHTPHTVASADDGTVWLAVHIRS